MAFATHRTQQEKHKGRVGGDPENVVIMQNKAVDPSEMDKSKVYVQIGAVNPHADSSRVTPHARNFHISTPPAPASIDSVPPASHAHLFSLHFGLSSAVDSFIFETGYTAQGKNVAEGLARQQKKKIMFKTSLCFPYILARLPVVSTENVRIVAAAAVVVRQPRPLNELLNRRHHQVILTPLENAVELIENRVAALREQLETNPPRLNALHSVIQGSVVTSTPTPHYNFIPPSLVFMRGADSFLLSFSS